MTSAPEPTTDPASIATLVKRCVSLCESADILVSGLAKERETFLALSLGDTLQQLELILRALNEGTVDEAREEERSGLLRRLSGRKSEKAKVPDRDECNAPRFDVSKHGLHGNSWTIPLSELLGFLAFGRKTGVLWVDAPEENFLIGLVDGDLMHATSDHAPPGLRLGEVLVSYGYLTNRQLDRFLEQQESADAAISGEVLLGAGMINDDELRSALAYQTQQLFHRLVATRNAVFRFREGMQIPLAYHVKMNINSLLLDSARVLDEAATSERMLEDELSTIMGEEAGGADPTTRVGASSEAGSPPGDDAGSAED